MEKQIVENAGFVRRLAFYVFLAYVFTLGFMQPRLLTFGPKLQVSDLLFVILFILWLISILNQPRLFRAHRFYWVIIFYILAGVFSLFVSDDPRADPVKLAGNIYLVSLPLITFDLVRTLVHVKKVIFTWLAASMIISIIGTATVVLFYLWPDNFLNHFSEHHYGTLIPGNYPRIQTTFFYPSMLCNYLSVSLLLLLAAFENVWVGKKTFIVLLTVFSITVFFTLTPGLGAIFLTVGIWFFLVYRRKENALVSKAFLFTGVLAAALFLLVTLVSPINTASSPYQIKIPVVEKEIQPSVRVLTWESSLKTFLENPIFGKGLGTNAAHVKYLDASGRMQLLTDAHQILLNVAAQTGLIGLAAIVFLAGFILVQGFPKSPRANLRQNIKTALFLSFLSAFIYQGLVGSFEDARHLWVLMGLILSVSYEDPPQDNGERHDTDNC